MTIDIEYVSYDGLRIRERNYSSKLTTTRSKHYVLEKQIDVPIYAISYQPFFPVILDGIILSIKNYTTFFFSFAWTYPKTFLTTSVFLVNIITDNCDT